MKGFCCYSLQYRNPLCEGKIEVRVHSAFVPGTAELRIPVDNLAGGASAGAFGGSTPAFGASSSSASTGFSFGTASGFAAASSGVQSSGSGTANCPPNKYVLLYRMPFFLTLLAYSASRKVQKITAVNCKPADARKTSHDIFRQRTVIKECFVFPSLLVLYSVNNLTRQKFGYWAAGLK